MGDKKNKTTGVVRNAAGKKVRVGGGKTVKGKNMVHLPKQSTVQSKGIRSGNVPRTITKRSTKKVTPKKFKKEYGKKAYTAAKKSGIVKRTTSTKLRRKLKGNR